MVTGRQIINRTVFDGPHTYLRVRRPQWANPEAYYRVSLLRSHDGSVQLGPWLHLFDRKTQEAISVETPQAMLILGKIDSFHKSVFDLYTGPLDPADDPR